MALKDFVLDKPLLFSAIDESLAMIYFDTKGNVLWANKNFAKAMGYKLEEIPGLHHRKFCFSQFANSPQYEAFWANLRKGIPFHNKAERVTKDGKRLWLEAFYTPVFNDNGSVEGVVKIATDITERQIILENSSHKFISVVEEMTASTTDVYDATQAIVSDMSVLNKESEVVKQNIKQIQSVVSFVRDIATQSNLLGLNASIEAARAGEHGRGFSIVAQEVRKMAENSKSSANDISHQLHEMVTSMAVMMEMVKSVTDKIDTNSNSIEELKKAYQEIARTADELANII